jgi:hypothetical protein
MTKPEMEGVYKMYVLIRGCAKRSSERDSCNAECGRTRSTDSFDTEGKELAPASITSFSLAADEEVERMADWVLAHVLAMAGM